MKCRDCKHFHIIQEPIRIQGEIYDAGRAECEKHNLYVDYVQKKTINKLECVEGGGCYVITKNQMSELMPLLVLQEIRKEIEMIPEPCDETHNITCQCAKAEALAIIDKHIKEYTE